MNLTRPAVAILALALAGCSASIRATSPPEPTATRTPPTKAPTSTPLPAPIPSDTGNPSGSVGDSFTVSGGGSSYSVRLVRVLQHAAPSDEFEAAGPGKHLAGAHLIITGVSGHESDDANNDITAQGSDGQTYQPSFDTLAAGTDFDSGQFRVGPGDKRRGWVSFEIPDGVRVTELDWTPESGFNDTVASWRNI